MRKVKKIDTLLFIRFFEREMKETKEERRVRLMWRSYRRHWRSHFQWMRNFVLFSFRRERKGFVTSSSTYRRGSVITRYCGVCPIYEWYYSWWKTEIRLGRLCFLFNGKKKQCKKPHTEFKSSYITTYRVLF